MNERVPLPEPPETGPFLAANEPTAEGDRGLAFDERHDHLLRSLVELNRDLTVSLNLFDTTDLLLFNLMGQVGSARSALWLSSERDGVLAIVRSHGFNRRLVDGALAASHDGLLEHIARRGNRPRTWIAVEELTDESFKLIHQARIALIAPLRARGERIGWIALAHRVDGQPYSPADLDVLETALGMIAMALENTRLFNRVREINRGLTVANEHLTEMDRLKSQFMNNVNHELRTPLAVVIGSLECALECTPVDPVARRMLETAKDAAGNLGAIIENLLLWSECARDRLVVNFEEGDVRTLLEFAYRNRLPGITEELRELLLEIDERTPLLGRYDRNRLLQIVDELLDNAVKFTPRGTRLYLRGRLEESATGNRIRIDVEDNGPGIPADRLPSLFRSFEQVDGSMTRSVGGLGLGLAFTYTLAERMGGSLVANSRVGAGTIFTLRLPVAEGIGVAPEHRAA